MHQINREKDDPIRPGYAPAESRIYYGWIVVATCFLVIAPVAPLLTSFSIFQVPILDEFHWSRGSFAIALSIHLVFSGLAAPVAGGLIDRFGPRRVMPVGDRRRVRDKAGAKAETGGGEPEQGNRGGGRTQVVILDKEWAEVDWTVGKASRTFRFWALALVLAFFAAGSLLIALQLVAYLGDMGYSSIIVASVVGLQGMLNMVGEFIGGFLCDRIGREKTLTLSLVMFGAGVVLLRL